MRVFAFPLIGLAVTACGGDASRVAASASEVRPASEDDCPHGGVEIVSGTDADGDGTLSDDEINQRQVVCEGSSTLTEVVDATDEECPDGGIAILIGEDADGDGQLSDSEVQYRQVVCDGARGAPGSGGGGVGLGVQVIEGDVQVSSTLDLLLLIGVERIEGSLTIDCGGQSLSSLAPLASLNAITDGFTLRECGGLVSLSGLDGLGEVGGFFDIDQNSDLTSLTGLGGLTVVGVFRIRWNDALVSLEGLEALTTVEGIFTIEGNDALASLDGLAHLTTVEGNFRISGASRWGGANNDALTSIGALGNLSTVEGSLIVSRFDALTSLTGLEGLSTTGGIVIDGNSALTTLSGLDNVTTVGGDLRISGDDALTTLSGLDNVTAVGGDLRIESNPLLTMLSGLDSVTAVGGDLRIESNPLLTMLSGLDNVTAVGGDLRIESNNTLSSLTDLHGLTAVNGALVVSSNASLPCTERNAFETATGLTFTSWWSNASESPCIVVAAAGIVIISEFSTRGPTGSWYVEVAYPVADPDNPGSDIVSLAGVKLVNFAPAGGTAAHEFGFPEDATVAAGGTYVVVRDEAVFATAYPDAPSPNAVNSGILANHAGPLALLDESGAVFDIFGVQDDPFAPFPLWLYDNTAKHRWNWVLAPWESFRDRQWGGGPEHSPGVWPHDFSVLEPEDTFDPN